MKELKAEWELNYDELFTQEEKNWLSKLMNSKLDYWNPDSKKLGTKEKAYQISIKDKIKNFFYEKTNYRCSYCNTSLQDRNIETDREHIVPKSHKSILTYNLFNLTVACKRCNMSYKNTTLAHIEPSVLSTIDQESNLYNKNSYLIPHPNIDKIFGKDEHIFYFRIDDGENNIVIYNPITEKGKFLSELVNLKGLTTKNIDELQSGQKDIDIDYVSMLVRGEAQKLH
ncbi:hypothetical protein B9T11_08795 [Wohlfahrtiimonas chitiniclastica]|uniref:HNH endonuclease n=1 Tax=Wohlfahrtiimonas chitiniclastica TaxID=400946 RepID=UPI000B97E7C8|nr:HNH endonuclease signature motif containing protein [Wohlfahrtiimonas chitiniclastica]OYQ79323.1 hypothetical protein B9T11_08795 [Wohlfahrtiimonas chitiniclastica]